MAVTTETRRPFLLPSFALGHDLVRHAGLAATGLLAAGAAWLMASATIARHEAFHSNAFDLGYFDQLAWNTAQGRWFESGFITFNFLGQHFEPVWLLFAVLYRFGAGPETLLLVQALGVSLAAVPVYFAARRFSGSDLAGVLCAAAFLLGAATHRAVNFDFHPELLCFLFVFSSAAFLAGGRPWAAAFSLLPLLLLKEDMALIVMAIALLIGLRGARRPAAALTLVAGSWFVVTALVLMPSIRGNAESDFTNRYAYLTDGTTLLSRAPVAASRAVEHVGTDTAVGLGRLLLSTGGLPLLNPPGLALAAGLAGLNGAAQHPEQAELRMHYAAPTLALLWFAALLALDWLRRRDRRLPVAAAAVMAACAAVGFVAASPFAPWRWYSLDPAKTAALHEGLALIPPDASVEAQSTIQPHLSQRRAAYEFPDARRGDYVILTQDLTVSRQSRANHFDRERDRLPADGYVRIYASHGVEVWRAVR